MIIYYVLHCKKKEPHLHRIPICLGYIYDFAGAVFNVLGRV